MFSSALNKNKKKKPLGEIASPTEIFGAFRGLDIPFAGSKYPQFSPLYGLFKQIIKNLRVNGHYGSSKTDHMQPTGYSADNDPLYPQDATAALIKILFPSSVGLVVNSSPADSVNDCLKPKNIAEIFKVIANPEFYTQQTTVEFMGEEIPQSVMDLCEALMPDVIKTKWLRVKERNKQNGARNIKYIPSEEHKANLQYIKQLSTLLYQAFKETEGNNANASGYPAYVVERALLCYMWEKNKYNKANLKPYYDVLVKAGLIEKSLVAQIVWSGSDSYYAEEHYRNPENITALEKEVLLKLGYANFDDRFPAAVEYGISCIMVNGKRVYYSDCGDTLIRNFFMMMLYNFETKKFDVSRLRELLIKRWGRKVSEKLINYFECICTCPAQADSLWARYKWSEVVYGLNDECESDEEKIIYRSENKMYEINVGLDNIIKVIFKLLGESLDKYKTEMKCHWINRLNLLCYIFSDRYPRNDNSNLWKIKISTYNHKHDGEECESFSGKIPSDGWIDLNLIFSYGSKKEGVNNIFEWQIEDRHFGFNRCIKPRDQDRDFGSIQDFPEFIFSLRMNTFEEKIYALDIILQHVSVTGSQNYQFIINKWLEVSGANFTNWRNLKVNASLGEVLLKYMSVKSIINLKIPELNYAIMLPLVRMRRLADISLVLDYDWMNFVVEDNRTEAVRNRLQLRKVLPSPSHRYKFSDVSRALEQTLLKGTNDDLLTLCQAGANTYAKGISGLTLLHLAAFSGNKNFTSSLFKLGVDVNAKTDRHDTPLHFAVISGSSELVEQLLMAGANVDAINKNGHSVLHVATNFYYNWDHAFDYELSSDPTNPIENFVKSPYTVYCFDDKTIVLLKKYGADFEQTHFNEYHQRKVTYHKMFDSSPEVVATAAPDKKSRESHYANSAEEKEVLEFIIASLRSQ